MLIGEGRNVDRRQGSLKLKRLSSKSWFAERRENGKKMPTN